MKIGPNEIAYVEEAGELDSSPVKLVRTKGGFWIAIGKLMGRQAEEALAAGSHPAIVKYNLEKQYPKFQPAMMKSEDGVKPKVEQHSHFLNDELRKSGHDIHSIQTGTKIEFYISRHGAELAKMESQIEDGNLVFKKLPKLEKSLSLGFAGAVSEKVLSCQLKKIVLQGIEG